MTSSADALSKARQLHREGQLEAALQRCDEALESESGNFDALYLSGLIAAQLGSSAMAVERFDAALAVDPLNAAAHCNKAVALQDLKRWAEALCSCDAALAIKPDYAVALNNRGKALGELARRAEALQSYDQAIRIRPDYVSAHVNRANTLQALQRFEAAVAGYDAALKLDGRHAPAHSNRGAALCALNRLSEALASFQAAIRLRPDFAEAHFGNAITLLLDGQWEAGLREFEWRPLINRIHGTPRWTGRASIAGKTLLIHCERGLGDTLQYCRYVALLSDLQASVVLQVQEPLVAVLQDLRGASRVIGLDHALPAHDFHCPLLSLPFIFETRVESVPAPRRYLQADPDRVARWRAALAASPGVRIGLVWRGDPDNQDDVKRSMSLKTLLEALPPQLRYVSLQKDLSDTESAIAGAHPGLSVLRDELGFPDTAALCECLDLVISVDTSVAHLSGALGRPTWILLPFNPDCRWLLIRSDTPWYPSVTLYRQPQRQEWGAVLERIAQDLRSKYLEP